jgi:hypothetical protein
MQGRVRGGGGQDTAEYHDTPDLFVLFNRSAE